MKPYKLQASLPGRHVDDLQRSRRERGTLSGQDLSFVDLQKFVPAGSGKPDSYPQGIGFIHRTGLTYPQAPRNRIILDRGSLNRGNVKRRRDFRPDQHRSQTQSRLIFSGLLILAGMGGVLVWAFYGGAAALTAVVCLLAGAGILGLLWLILTLLELWVKKDEP